MEANEPDVKNCPNCGRPMNIGNSPNITECGETDDEVCETYAEMIKMINKLYSVLEIQKPDGDYDSEEEWQKCVSKRYEVLKETREKYHCK